MLNKDKLLFSFEHLDFSFFLSNIIFCLIFLLTCDVMVSGVHFHVNYVFARQFLGEDYEKAEMQRGFKMVASVPAIVLVGTLLQIPGIHIDMHRNVWFVFGQNANQRRCLGSVRTEFFLRDIMKIRVGGLGGWGDLPVISVYFCVVTWKKEKIKVSIKFTFESVPTTICC